MRFILQVLSLLLPALTSGLAHAEIKIGWIGPLTGNAAALGVDSSAAVQLAVDQINRQGGIDGEKIQLFIEDDQYESAKTVRAYSKLVHQQGVKTLLIVT